MVRMRMNEDGDKDCISVELVIVYVDPDGGETVGGRVSMKVPIGVKEE